MSKRDVGEMGEKTLGVWTSQVGISANKANPDKTGWDFLLELPPSRDSSVDITLPLDKESYPMKCLVQVKSTDQQRRRWSIKLDNWTRLVKSPLPAFFLVLEFDSKNSCQRAFLVHIDERYIRRVLKKLRGLDSSRRSELHKIKLQFSYKEPDRLPSLDGTGLEWAIRNYVGNSLESYAVKKMELVRTIGYENGGCELDFTTPVPPDIDFQEYLVDFTLGLIPQIQVSRCEIRDVRFGITAPELTKIFEEGGTLEITNRQSAGKGTIVLSTSDGKKELRLDTETHLPRGIGFELDRKYVKTRFEAPFTDVIFWLSQKDKCELKLKWPHPYEKHELKRLRPVSELTLLIQEAYTRSSRIDLEARFNSAPFGTGYVIIESPLDDHIIEQATAVNQAWTIAKHFDVHHDVELRVAELLQQQVQLELLAAILGPTQPSMKITYWSEEAISDDDKETCVPYIVDVAVGQYHMAIAIAIVGESRPTGQIDEKGSAIEIKTNDVRLCREHLWCREEDPQYTARDLVESVVKDYEKSTNVLLLEEMHSGFIDS